MRIERGKPIFLEVGNWYMRLLKKKQLHYFYLCHSRKVIFKRPMGLYTYIPATLSMKHQNIETTRTNGMSWFLNPIVWDGLSDCWFRRTRTCQELKYLHCYYHNLFSVMIIIMGRAESESYNYCLNKEQLYFEIDQTTT